MYWLHFTEELRLEGIRSEQGPSIPGSGRQRDCCKSLQETPAPEPQRNTRVTAAGCGGVLGKGAELRQPLLSREQG